MKNITLTVFILGLLLSINSCCTKKYCTGVDDMYEIEFYNFSQSELDTIIILSYIKNTNYSTSIDSFTTHAYSSGDYFTAYTNNKINIDLDYKIKLITIGKVITLTGFETKKEGCNACFPFRPESDFYKKLNAYQVNGIKQSGSQIKVYK